VKKFLLLAVFFIGLYFRLVNIQADAIGGGFIEARDEGIYSCHNGFIYQH